jgi:WD40 repeat protein
MPRPRLYILLTLLSLLIFAPPAVLLFGNFNRPTPRDRANAAVFDKPIPPRASIQFYLPPGSTPGELKRFGRGTLVSDLALSPDARTVAAVSTTDNSLHTFVLDGSSSSSWGTGAYNNYAAVTFAPDGQRVLAGPHGAPILWNLRAGQLQYLQSSFADPITSLAIAPNGHSAISGSGNAHVRVWNLDTFTEIGLIAALPGGGSVIAVAYAPDGQRIHAASDIGDIRTYQLKDGTGLTGRHYGLPWRVAAFSPDARLLVTGTNNGAVGIYDLQDNGNQRLQFKAAVGPVTAVAFSPDASRFATASGTQITLWETATGKQLSTLRAPNQRHVRGALAILPTNQHLLFGGDGISLLLMPAPTTQPAN